MEIYLVRHTAPAVASGVCYGQSDIGVIDTFLQEAQLISQQLPSKVAAVYSSPLQRCTLLATHLFPQQAVITAPDLMEINCGHWELQRWDDIPKAQLDPWMNDFVHVRIPGGESYTDLFERCTRRFDECCKQPYPAVLVVHGGVIRSILSYITGTALIDSFNQFSLYYGCVIKIFNQQGKLHYEVLSNIPHPKETHKPSGY
jgi:alpha-ribazole phosphatase